MAKIKFYYATVTFFLLNCHKQQKDYPVVKNNNAIQIIKVFNICVIDDVN